MTVPHLPIALYVGIDLSLKKKLAFLHGEFKEQIIKIRILPGLCLLAVVLKNLECSRHSLYINAKSSLLIRMQRKVTIVKYPRL